MIEENRKLLRIIIYIVILYLINKFLFRPLVLSAEMPLVLDIIVLSLPNLCEAIVGSLFISNVGLYLFQRKKKVEKVFIYLVSVCLAGTYVILQELKIHNLGGQNTYDPYDLLFSVIGLVLALVFLIKTVPSQQVKSK